jgi:uncharacterized damage-inducible protein DinB
METTLILEQNLHFLRQGLALLDALDAETYAAGDGGRASIGAHLRHCTDFYNCFLRGLESGRVDYDARCRDAAVETDRQTAARTLAGIAERLAVLGAADFGRVLEVKADAADDAPFAWSRSSLARELQFLTSHTVHHFALIALLMRQRGLDPGDELGVAPSTLAYRNAVTAG